MEERLAALAERLAEVQQRRCRVERWSGLLFTLALLLVSVSLILFSERFGRTQSAHPRRRPPVAPR
jgi:hypothetical protein